MTEEKPPVAIQELLQLQNVGIAANHVTWTRVTMTSDSHICLRCKRTDQGTREQMTVLDLQRDCSQSLSLPHQSQSCMVSPGHHTLSPLLAFRANERLYVQRLSEGEEDVQSCQLEGFHYWTWLSHTYLGLVTDTAVWKWNVRQGGKPEEVFLRCPRLDFAEIISLKADQELKVFALVGLLPQETSISGLTEIFFVEKQYSQCIGAHAVSFCEYQFTDNQQPSTVMCAASRDDPDNLAHGKVHVVEVAHTGDLAPRSLIQNIRFPEEQARFDFPMAVHVSTDTSLIFTLTKYGRLYVCDLETTACLCSAVISEDVVFTSALNTATQGVLAVSTNGKVLSVDLKPPHLLKHIRENLKKPAIADRLEHVLSKIKPDPPVD